MLAALLCLCGGCDGDLEHVIDQTGSTWCESAEAFGCTLPFVCVEGACVARCESSDDCLFTEERCIGPVKGDTHGFCSSYCESSEQCRDPFQCRDYVGQRSYCVPESLGDDAAELAPWGDGQVFGWNQARFACEATCEPDAEIALDCCGCDGDPRMGVLDAETFREVARHDDAPTADECGQLCPRVTFPCPPSGGYSVWTTDASDSGHPYTCEVSCGQ